MRSGSYDTRISVPVIGMMAFILGAAVVVQPLVLVGAVGAVILISLVTRPWGRLVIFVVGALITLQSSEGLTVWKLGYVALTVLCAAIAAHRCLRDGEDRAIRLSIFGVGLLGFLMLLSAVRPLWTGQATAGDVARDAITYGLIMAAVPIGADAGRHIQQRVIVYVIVAAGLLSSVAIALDWLDRRGVSTLGQGRVAFGSGLIVAVAVALAAVKALGGPRVEVTWLMLLVVLPLGVLVTGARSGAGAGCRHAWSGGDATQDACACVPYARRRNCCGRVTRRRLAILGRACGSRRFPCRARGRRDDGPSRGRRARSVGPDPSASDRICFGGLA